MANEKESSVPEAPHLPFDLRLTVLDARFVPLSTLRSLVPDLVIAIPVEVVEALSGLSRSTIWAKCDADKPDTFDPAFPQPRKYPGLKRTVWNLLEVQAYLNNLFTPPTAGEQPGPSMSASSRKPRRRVARPR